MTLDQLISRAVSLREKHGGNLRVGCWPSSSDKPSAGNLEGVELVLVVSLDILSGGVRTFAMVEREEPVK